MSQLDVTLARVSHKEQEKQEVFHSYLEDSVASIDNHLHHPDGEIPFLPSECWQTLRVVCDQRKAWVEVDGVRGAEVPVSGDLFYPLYTSVGAEKGSGFFSGRIRKLKIKPL